MEKNDKDIDDNKAVALLSYIAILCLIPLLIKRDSEFTKFHAKQGLVMLIGWFFAWIPFVGWLLGAILFIFSIMGIVNVLNGKKVELPVVGNIAKMFNI